MFSTQRNLGLISAGFLVAFHPASDANAATVVMNYAPVAFAAITPTAVLVPPITSSYGAVQGDTRAGGSPSRVVIEFPLAGISSSTQILSASFTALGFGGSAASSPLQMGLFGYAATSSIDLDTGIDPVTGASLGSMLSGPYIINSFTNPNLSNIDVTLFIQFLIDAGATHAGFMFRDINTADNTLTRSQNIVVQDSPNWGGDTPPSLVVTMIPEPSTSLLGVVAAALLLRRRR